MEGGRPHGVREGSVILCLETWGEGGVSGELHATATGSRGNRDPRGDCVHMHVLELLPPRLGLCV